MAEDSTRPEPTFPSEPSDPRLAIPEVLRRPAPTSDFDPVTGSQKAREEAHDVVGMGKAWATALSLVFSVLAGAGLGWLIDRWRGSLPLWTLVGFGLGFVTGFIRIIQATRLQEAADRRQGRGQ